MTNPRGSPPGGEQPQRPEPSLGPGAWLAWARANPALAVAVLVFCFGALAVLALNVPVGAVRSSRPGQLRATASRTPDPGRPADSPSGGSGSWGPSPPAASEPAVADPAPPAGPWVEQAPAPPSPRGLALVYRYRKLPPGGESNYQWIVQVRGALALLEQVDLVTWQMDPAPKNDEGELISRDRARDGFPLFGDGPGGWFGVSAVVTFKGGDAETLSRKIELPDPS